MRGRKPQPTALKILKGNPGKRRLNDAEPVVERAIPEPLGSLTPEALKHFHKLAQMLSDVGVLSVNEGVALSVLSQSIADYEEATRELAKGDKVMKGHRGPVRSPWTVIQKQAVDQMYKGFTDFGMTPSSRSTIRAIPAQVHNEWDEFFS